MNTARNLRHIVPGVDARRPVFNGPPAAGAAEMRDAINELNETFAAFREANDNRIGELERGREDVVTNDKVERINTAVTEMQGVVDGMNERIQSMRVGGGDNDNSPEQEAYAEAFDRFFRRGVDDGLADLAVQAALTTSSDPDGGFVVTEEMDAAIDRVLESVGAMRSLATVRSISTATFKKLVTTSGASAGWVGEKDARPETSTPKLSAIEYPTMELYANPAATQTLLDDMSVDLAAWLADEVSMEFSEQESDAFINGDGVAKPRGILSYDTVANASWVWGKLGFIVSGAAATFATTDPGDAFINLIYGLKRGFRNNAAWIMNELTTGEVRKFKDGQGNYLWQPSSQAGEPAQFLGYRHEADDFMPDVGANAFPVAFGDFRRGYLIIDRVGTRVLRDPFTNKPYIHFYTTKRVGGGIANYQAIKLLKIST